MTKQVGSVEDSVSIVLADGEELVASGIARLISDIQGLEVVARSKGASEAVRYTLGHRPDCVLFVPTVETTPAIEPELIKRIKAASPATQIVVLSSSANADRARATLRAGVLGFVLKTEGIDAVAEALHLAKKGYPYVSARLGVEIARLPESKDAVLTAREDEILRLVALGYTNSEVAEQLFLSVRTVESHRAQIVRKLDLQSRAELVQYAIENHLLP